MKAFDRFDKGNKELYNDRAYKILPADKAFDLGLYEEKILKNGRVKMVKSKAGPWISWRNIMTNTSPTCLKKAETS